MANIVNYAEKWQPKLLAIVMQEAITSPFIESNVDWLDAKTFHFTQMATSGYRNHQVGAEAKTGKFTETDHPYVISHDRDISFLLDKVENLESGGSATIENINMVFQKVHAAKELDALFFEKCAQAAITAGGEFAVEENISAFTQLNAINKLITAISKVKRYRNSLMAYVSTEVMNLIELALADKARVNVQTISDYENSIQTRVANVQGVPVVEVLDDECFYTKFDYLDTEDGGFEPNSVSGHKINILIASRATCKTVKKIQSIFVFAPGTHTKGDGWYTYTRDLFDTFVMPNGKDGAVDSVYVSYSDEPAAA